MPKIKTKDWNKLDFGEKLCRLFNRGLNNEEAYKYLDGEVLIEDLGELLVARIRVLENECGILEQDLDEARDDLDLLRTALEKKHGTSALWDDLQKFRKEARERRKENNAKS